MAVFKFFLTFCFALTILPQSIYSQTSKTGRLVDQISQFIASDEFATIRKNAGEVASVDSIFTAALKVSDYNISDALAACTWACLTVKNATVVTPLLGMKLTIPFFSSDEQNFLTKNKNLPRYLFIDSPKSGTGDVDKLAHFFGSAYLEYNSLISGVSEFFGYFIEVFEESFKVDSRFSSRDIIVNKIGIKFGSDLREKPGSMPSNYLKEYKTEK